MDELKRLSDQDLHNRMLVTSQKERELTTQMISMIEEAGRRKFFLDFGFASLFDYLTQGLKYSAGAAMRRIAAARIVREIPEVKERILEGSLSLSNLSQAEQFFRNEEKYSQGLNAEQKREVLNQVKNKSTRETEKILIALSSVPEEQLKEDKLKPLTPELTQITFKANAEFMAQLEEVKGLLAHQKPDATLTEIMAEVMSLAVAGLRKQKFKVVEVAKVDAEEQSAASRHSEPPESVKDLAVVSGAGNEGSGSQNSRYIPASIRRKVFLRDQGRCAVVNPITGKVCGSGSIHNWPILGLGRSFFFMSLVSDPEGHELEASELTMGQSG